MFFHPYVRKVRQLLGGPGVALSAGRDERLAQQLAAQGVGMEETLITKLLHTGSQLDGLGLDDGRAWPLAVLYAGLPRHQASDLPARLGCELDEQNLLRVDALNQTTVPGVYAVGDNCSLGHQLAQAIGVGNRVGAERSRDLILRQHQPVPA